MCCAGSCVAQVGSLPSFSPPLQVYQKECLREELHEEQWEWEEASGTFDFCLVLLCNHVLLLLLFLWICTFIFLCLRPVYVYSYLPSSNSTVSKGMKDVLVPTPPTRQKYVSHFVFQGQRDAWGDLRLIFFLSPTTCCASPLHYIFFSKCQTSWGTPNTLSDSSFGFSHNWPKTHNKQTHAFSDLMKIRSASVHSVDPSLGFAVALARVVTLMTLSMPSISWLFAIRVCLKYRVQKYRSVKMCI